MAWKWTKADPDRVVCRLISAAIDRSGKTRHEIAAEMSAKLERNITKGMLDGWSSQEKKQLRLPLSFVAAFCEVTGDDELQRFAIGPRLRRALVVGEGEIEKKKAACRS